MLQFFIFASLSFGSAIAYGAGGSGASSRSGGYSGSGGASGAMRATSLALGGSGGGGAGTGFSGGVVPAAIQTRHNVEFRDVPSTGSVNPTVVEVGSNSLPVTILFRSSSSTLNIQQAHDGAQGSTQESSSEDEAHVLKHSVKKPIIQEVHEVITPFRKITQEIEPVQEEINTIVARNSGGGLAIGEGNSGFGGAQLGGSSNFGFSSGSGSASGGGGSSHSGSTGKTSSAAKVLHVGTVKSSNSGKY